MCRQKRIGNKVLNTSFTGIAILCLYARKACDRRLVWSISFTIDCCLEMLSLDVLIICGMLPSSEMALPQESRCRLRQLHD
jgi:hypothetical protein